MQTITFLREVEKLPNSVFLLNDVARIIGKSREYSRVYIHRIKQRNLIYEIENGKYSLTDDAFEIAAGIIFPSYISFLTAYHIYGLTTQIPVVVQVAAAKSKKTITMGNTRIEFIKFKKGNIFGYKRNQFRGKYIFLAEPEKAIVDSLYLPKYCPISESYGALKSKELNYGKLAEYSLLMNSIVTIKRLGYLLELNGVDIYEKIKYKLNQRYDLLNPFLKKSKVNSSKWKLNINEALNDY